MQRRVDLLATRSGAKLAPLPSLCLFLFRGPCRHQHWHRVLLGPPTLQLWSRMNLTPEGAAQLPWCLNLNLLRRCCVLLHNRAEVSAWPADMQPRTFTQQHGMRRLEPGRRGDGMGSGVLRARPSASRSHAVPSAGDPGPEGRSHWLCRWQQGGRISDGQKGVRLRACRGACARRQRAASLGSPAKAPRASQAGLQTRTHRWLWHIPCVTLPSQRGSSTSNLHQAGERQSAHAHTHTHTHTAGCLPSRGHTPPHPCSRRAR